MRELTLVLFLVVTQSICAGASNILNDVTGEGRVCIAASVCSVHLTAPKHFIHNNYMETKVILGAWCELLALLALFCNTLMPSNVILDFYTAWFSVQCGCLLFALSAL